MLVPGCSLWRPIARALDLLQVSHHANHDDDVDANHDDDVDGKDDDDHGEEDDDDGDDNGDDDDE